MRLEPVEIGGVRILNDAYNANPDSMKAALESFTEVAREAKRRVVVLGDMLELGEHSEASHAEIGERLASTEDLDLIVLVGSRMEQAASRLRAAASDGRLVRIEELDEAHAAEVASMLRPGDLLLLKGSRRMRLERLVGALRTRTQKREAKPVLAPD
jgi:UDP-N-acetylmuramoyl-tripeptide--D-alanyl-D-alanine ligase